MSNSIPAAPAGLSSSSRPQPARAAGFTLLELLVVVTILSIVGAGLLVAYDRLDQRAARGVSVHSLAATDAALRSHALYTRQAPNDLDSLVAAEFTGGVVAASGSQKLAIAPVKILDKTHDPISLNARQALALKAAGITRLRYVDPAGNDPANPAPGSGQTVTLTVPNADGGSAVVGPLLDVDIPHRVHETPRPGSGRNRGRGFSGQIGEGSPVLQWDGDRSGGGGFYDNTKLKAAPEDVLLIFGLGNDASIVGAAGGDVQLASAPVYGGNLRSYEYGRYLLVYNVGPLGAEFSSAKLQAVLNTHGDFVDEMFSEFAGQKDL
jgi:prepilin-type N-terminal cleavage/methylation domain-containing protein